ncbi:MAG TPA: ribokinase [Candidatus Hydrogenedentes bacterium]|nr:ribokinase [Candidatus Hydrogenedentota bacterium]HOS03416.1 ribokinase [Candidatus Hydrogenedentota bacterium]
MSPPRVLVIGSANVDLVTRAPRTPRPGETLLGRSFAVVMGGKGANQAVAAARLGGNVWFAGCVGADSFGGMQRRALGAEGIDLAFLRTHPSEPTGTAVIVVADEGQNSIIVTPSANAAVRPEDVAALEPLMDRLDMVVVQLEIPLDAVDAALGLARTHGVPSILDPGVAQALPDPLLRKAAIVSPNETETQAITGMATTSLDAAREAAQALCDRGAREVVLKLGALGSYYAGSQGAYHAPAFRVAPVDTTAAGDAFTGALAVSWGRLDIRETLRFANAAGAIAATIEGAQPSAPTRAAVEAFLAENESQP